jgi:exodeoxyribonuclease V alpha subunit
VGPGTFLRDLIRSGRARTTRLDVIFRQAEASLIIRNSHRINNGRPPEFAGAEKPDADFFFIERHTPLEMRDTVLAMVTERIPKKLECDATDGVQVLSPMRRGPLGTHELNELLQEKLNPDGKPIGRHQQFRVGDKVIQTANNYDLDVYNGDVGRIQGVHHETGQVRVVFGKRVVHYPPENLDELELAYAITVHKSQGSEYPAVVMLLHTSHYIMLKRNLVYTGITRGKKLVVLIGNKKALFKAIGTSPESERLTALEHWLTHPPEKTDLFA